MKVKIVSADSQQIWYSDKIGSEYECSRSASGDFVFVSGDCTYWIWSHNVEIIEDDALTPTPPAPVPAEDVTCSFCGDGGFDLIGLKLHLTRGYCAIFDNTPRV